MKRISTVGPKSCGGVRIGYVRPVQFLDHLTVIKILAEMEVAPRYTLLSLFLLFKLHYTAQTVAYMPVLFNNREG